MKKIYFICLLLASVFADANVFTGQLMSFVQPNGDKVELKLFGNEYYMRAESLDGYTLIRDKKSNWICYARLNGSANELVSTGIVYEMNTANSSYSKFNSPLEKHIDINDEAKKKLILSNKERLGAIKHHDSNSKSIDNGVDQTSGTPIHNVSGSILGLCIVVDFSDEPGTLAMSEFDNFCNDLNYTNFGNNGSLRTFYSDISGGLLDYQNVVFGYYRPALTFAQYEAMPYAQGAQQILGEALNWIDGQGFDFSTLSINTDGSIQAINLMYTGHPQNWAQGMWFHKGNYAGFSADGVHSDDYNCSPANSPLELAVVAHENGHMIGKWPDTYKYDSNNGLDGLGTFDLMCYYGNPLNPSIPNPLFLNNVGWNTIIDVTYYNGINMDTSNSQYVYQYRNLNDTNEFFLLQSRLQQGRSSAIDDEGLTIWHIDRNGNNQTTHHEVYLEHANNDNSFHTQACFKQSFNNEFSVSTAPNSNWYNGDPSGLRVWDIGIPATIMNYKLGSGAAGPSLNLIYNSFSNDNNGNGFIEPSESADVLVDATNFGQLSSGTCTVSCVPVGANAANVTVNTAAVNVGVINVSQTIPVTFNFSLNSATALGSTIDLKFTITDGVNTTYITKQFIVGYVVSMNNNTSVTNCSVVFYDQGLESNYNDNTSFTKTFYPVTAGDKVQVVFQEFELEDFTNCGYDYLKIYNNQNASSGLLGTWCGTNSPGTITSTHASGALTFKFFSDPGVTALGWKAIISCVSGVGVEENLTEDGIVLYPNPTEGVLNINFNSPVKGKIILLDRIGRILMQKDIGSINELIDLTGFSNGIYVLNIQTEAGSVNKKIVLNR